MSVLSEIFTPAFFMILAIVFIFLALLIIYFENKWREQNHKISSMLSLVSSLAEEINVLRFNFINFANNKQTNNSSLENNEVHMQKQEFENSLILVSDDEDDDLEDNDSEDNDLEDNDSEDNDSEDNDSEDNDSEDNDSEDNDSEDLEEEYDKTNIIKLNISQEEEDDFIETNDIKVLKINMENKKNEENEENEENENHEENDLAEFDVESVSELEILSEEKQFDLKSISISNLEESKNDEPMIDYKKLSLQKLKSIVTEKGLISDASKLKKHDLLSLLGVI